MGIDSTASTTSTDTNSMKTQLEELRLKYEASKVTLAGARDARLKKLNIFTARRNEYSSDPKNSNLIFPKNDYDKANNDYIAADQDNDRLNMEYFDAILDTGRLMA